VLTDHNSRRKSCSIAVSAWVFFSSRDIDVSGGVLARSSLRFWTSGTALALLCLLKARRACPFFMGSRRPERSGGRMQNFNGDH
jgi:hypothetical protein